MGKLLRNYVDIIVGDLGGLVVTDDFKMADRMIKAEFPEWRQQAFFKIWNGCGPFPGFPSGIKGNHFLHPSNYQPADLVFNAAIQDKGAEYVLFDCEPPVNLAEDANGCIFCGDRLTGQTFLPLKSPGSYSTMKDAGLININKVYYNITNRMKVYGNLQLKQVSLDYLAADPLNVYAYVKATPTSAPVLTLFDPETQDYPMGEDVWAIVRALAYNKLKPESLTPADTTNDAAPTIERAVKR